MLWVVRDSLVKKWHKIDQLYCFSVRHCCSYQVYKRPLKVDITLGSSHNAVALCLQLA